MASVLGNTIDFFTRFGMFDVVLPFLLVFTIVFAILEKTKVLGEEKGEPRRNLNSMVAFVVGLIFVSVIRLVDIINQALPEVALVLIISVSLLMIVGLFWGSTEVKLEEPWQKGLVFIIAFFVVLGIFFNAIGWLDKIVDYVDLHWAETVIPTLIFFIVIIAAIFYIVGGKKEDKK
tara:strand:- start:856 stop:1383 length:528 start_codon:yes stop_codon:yes gene_type:complete